MEAQEFIAICKEVFPDCTIKGASTIKSAAKKKHPCLRVFTSGVGYYVAHLWDDRCVAWERGEDFCGKHDWTTDEFKNKLQQVKLSYGL